MHTPEIPPPPPRPTSYGNGNGNSPLPPQHRIWQNLIDSLTYICFLIIALFAAVYHVEDKSFWITFTVIVVGVLMRSRGGKIDPEVILKLLGSK